MKEIKGKWNNNSYLIIKKLGNGSIGDIYLVKDEDGRLYALKASLDIMSITKEYNILKKFSYINSTPQVYEIDDGYIDLEMKHFIVMEYIEGLPIKEYIYNDIDVKQIILFAIIIGEIFYEMYKIGYIYWDIKLENILVDSKNKKIRIVDFGGVSKIGESIKEYTPAYSAHCWNENSYDGDKSIIFSINMIIISLLNKKEYNPLTNSLEDIIYRLRNTKLNTNLKNVLIKGLNGDYNIDEYILKLKKLIENNQFHYNNRSCDWIDTFFWGSIGVFVVFIMFFIKGYIF